MGQALANGKFPVLETVGIPEQLLPLLLFHAISSLHNLRYSVMSEVQSKAAGWC